MEFLCIAGVNIKWFNCSKTVWHFLKKLNINLPYDPATAFLEIKPYVCTKTCVQVFIAAVFTRARK